MLDEYYIEIFDCAKKLVKLKPDFCRDSFWGEKGVVFLGGLE